MEEKKHTVAQEIEQRLTQAFSPEKIEVIDESHLHIGHAGYREGGESHFKLIIKSTALGEYSRVDKHKRIYAELSDLMEAKIHALSISCL
jgi:BolA protein